MSAVIAPGVGKRSRKRTSQSARLVCHSAPSQEVERQVLREQIVLDASTGECDLEVRIRDLLQVVHSEKQRTVIALRESLLEQGQDDGLSFGSFFSQELKAASR